MSETSAKRIDVFFYGLFMDDDLLREKGIGPTNRRIAFVENYSLAIGDRATLIPDPGKAAYGIVFSLTHDEVDQLYREPSVKAYRPEAVHAHLEDGKVIPALCFNLPEFDSSNDRNLGYAARLRELASHLNLPASYVQTI